MSQSKLKSIAINVDGGEGVGLGHASRGLGIASALHAVGYRPVFLVDPKSKLTPFLEENGYDVRNCKPVTCELILTCRKIGAFALVIDSYKFQYKHFADLVKSNLFIICFDDMADRELPVHIVINGSPAAYNIPYKTRPGTKRLFGLDYQVVRPEFVNIPSRKYSEKPHSILVTTGGDDLMGILPDLLDFFKYRFCPGHSGVEINFIIGPYFKDDIVVDLPDSFHIHRSPGDMRSLIMKADIAISAGGQTLYELARCDTPIIAFCVGEDQLPQLKALARLEIVDYVGWAKSEGWLDRLANSLDRLCNNSSIRRSLGQRASRLIDGRGAFRIAEVIGSLLGQQ